MKRLKILPKTFLYTLGLMLFIVVIAHALFYFLTPQAVLNISLVPDNSDLLINTKLNVAEYVTQIILKVFPISLICCVLISIVCSLLFSKEITVPIKRISAITERMARMDKKAACNIHTKDEIGTLADNINGLYQSLLSTIENLEIEKQRVSESEKSKVDFIRAASHELKTPVTALNATLENMILGVGKYQDYDTYLPECKEMTEQLGAMIHDILDTSKAGISVESETTIQTNLSELLAPLCEPYELIAKAHGIVFHIELSNSFSALLPPHLFSKAVSNVLANAVSYTETGKTISLYFNERSIIIQNECTPIPAEALRHLFEPFYRPDFARNRNEGGNGLGLYIVDTLLKAMNISYSFLPMEQPQGMRFTINL